MYPPRAARGHCRSSLWCSPILCNFWDNVTVGHRRAIRCTSRGRTLCGRKHARLQRPMPEKILLLPDEDPRRVRAHDTPRPLRRAIMPTGTNNNGGRSTIDLARQGIAAHEIRPSGGVRDSPTACDSRCAARSHGARNPRFVLAAETCRAPAHPRAGPTSGRTRTPVSWSAMQHFYREADLDS